MAFLAFAAPPARAAGSSGFTPFASFTAGLAADARAATPDPAEGAQITSYLTHLYRGVVVRTSFRTDGSYFDCVTVASQPTVTGLGIRQIPQPPPLSVLARGARVRGSAPVSTGIDQAGRVISCPPATVPMRRVTPAEVARAGGVQPFLRAKGAAPTAATDVPGYRHAYGFQNVNNDGAFSVLNVWNPKVAVGTSGDDHSLSQQWVIGGSGASTQTAEAGWTKDPVAFSAADPVYFSFFTPDDYTTGCYDLDCVGFVQTDNSVALGGPVTPCCSTPGKVNDAYAQEYVLQKGRWWLAINSTFIGYYPVSVYKGGQMSKHSTLVEYGGEVNGSATGVNWPQMGSGTYAKTGPDHAAYQDSIEYIGLTAKASDAKLTTVVTGAGSKPSPCYSLTYTPAAGGQGPFFYYGGPGGKQGTC